MGKRGPHPVQDLWFWEREWYAILKGLRDGTPNHTLQQLRFEPRKLSLHPDLQREFRNELRVRIRVAQAQIRGIPGERELWEKLLDADRVEEVQVICRQSQYWLNPRRSGKPFVEILSRRADRFVAAKNDRRYPASKRPSSDDKRLRFLARALAGITLGRSPRTSVDLLGEGIPRAHWMAPQGHGSGRLSVPLHFDFEIVKPDREVVPLNREAACLAAEAVVRGYVFEIPLRPFGTT